MIDLDRSAPGDPARDLAEFVHRMRSTMRREDVDVTEADMLTRAFLRTYAAENPEGVKNVPFRMGFLVLVSMCRHIKRMHKLDPAEAKATLEYYDAEFEEAVSNRYLEDVA